MQAIENEWRQRAREGKEDDVHENLPSVRKESSHYANICMRMYWSEKMIM